MKINVVNETATKVSELQLNKNIWGIKPNVFVQFASLIKYRANQRQATHKTKTRAEVAGGGRKPWKQKGTGNARQGSIRAPQWKGGGVVFGPNPERNYEIKLNKKQANLAIRSALANKFHSNNMIVIDEFNFSKPSTKQMQNILKDLKLADQKILIVASITNKENVIKSGRNIVNVTVVSCMAINIFDLLNNEKILITKAAINKIEETWNKCI